VNISKKKENLVEFTIEKHIPPQISQFICKKMTKFVEKNH